MIGPYLELVIIAIILIGIGVVIWRGGAANPIGTGKLLHDVSGMRQEQAAHGRRLKKLEQAAASAEDLEELREALKQQQARIETIDRQVGSIVETGKATASRVRHIDERQDKMAEDISGTRAEVAGLTKSVDRMYAVIVPKGMER